MTDQEREADIRKLMSDWYTSPKSNETPVVLLRLLDAERERVKTLEDAIRWALGEGGSDFDKCEPDNPGMRLYWWRGFLREKSALATESQD